VYLVGGMVPVVVARKLAIRASNPSGVTPSFKSFVKSRLRDPHIRTTASLYTLSSLALLSHVMPPIFHPSRRYPFALNPHLILYVSLSISLALGQTVRNSIRLRNVVQWTKYANAPGIHITFFPNLVINSIQALIANFILLPFFLLGYNASLPIYLRILSYLPIHQFLPVLHRSVHSYIPYPLSVPLLIWRTIYMNFGPLIGIITRNTLIWECANTVVDIYFAMVPKELGSDEKAVVNIVSGLSSDNEYFSYHAFNHLANLVKGSSAVRQMIYGDTKYNPNTWTALMEVCLGEKCLKGDQGELVRRGAPPPAPVVPPAPKKIPVPAPGTPIHLLRQSTGTGGGIFKSANQSPTQRFLDEALSSEGSAAKVIVSASERLGNLPGLFLAQSGDGKTIQPSTEPAKEVAPAPTAVTTASPALRVVGAANAVKSRLSQLLRRLTPNWMNHPAIDQYLNGERQDRIVRCWVRRVELDVRAIEILQILVTQSLTEDALGTVQRDIPKVLESLCGCLSVVEDAREELGKKVGLDVRGSGGAEVTSADEGMDDEKKVEVLRGLTEIEPLRAALESAVGSITSTFGQRLNVFSFTPKTERRLMPFMKKE